MARLPLAPFEKILKEADSGIRVSESAARALVEVAEDHARSIAREAAEVAKHSGRKTIMAEDIVFVTKKKGTG